MASLARRLIIHQRLWIINARPLGIPFHATVSRTVHHRLYNSTPTRLKQDNENTTDPILSDTVEYDIDEIEHQLRKAIKDGDTAEILRLSDRESMAPHEIEQLQKTLDQLKEAEDREAAYSNLADQLMRAPEDPETVDQIFKNSKLSESDIQTLPLTSAGEPANEEDILAVEKAVWDILDPQNVDMVTDEFESFLQKAGGNDKLAMREFVKHLKAKANNPAEYDATKYEEPFLTAPIEKVTPGFWNDDGKDPDMGEDEEFDQDDLPEKGHRWLDVQRDIREWSRYAVWELPLLSRLSKPFSPPDASQILKFRYTTYFGAHHPAERKVVVEFSPSTEALGLSPEQRAKLIKLAGNRYNPSKDVIKMSCESFFEPAQNKRYLGELVEILLNEAKDLSRDDFSDVPFDFRHHRVKRAREFPTKWIKTIEENAELVNPQSNKIEGPVVDGLLCIPGGAESREKEKQFDEQSKQQDSLWSEKRAELETLERDLLRVRIESRMEAARVSASTEERARGKMRKRDSYRLPKQVKLPRGLELLNDGRAS